ncbi:MAG: hypothetical protein EBZ65_04860 [Betaproteobacteria bacterium]|nr:hypothetical protein [Betaproteobacteria bacterium]
MILEHDRLEHHRNVAPVTQIMRGLDVGHDDRASRHADIVAELDHLRIGGLQDRRRIHEAVRSHPHAPPAVQHVDHTPWRDLHEVAEEPVSPQVIESQPHDRHFAITRSPCCISPEALGPPRILRDMASGDRCRGKLSRGQMGQHVRLANQRHVGEDAGIDALARQLLPFIQEFGALLLGEMRPWSIKEMWGNVMQQGGHQSIHNHANCMLSGIVYLTSTVDSTQTVFVKSMGGQDYKLSNENQRTKPTAFNSQRWRAPQASPGDALLFPSYLLHEVPLNQGAERMTVAFNAIPDRIDAWGYGLSFGA